MVSESVLQIDCENLLKNRTSLLASVCQLGCGVSVVVRGVLGMVFQAVSRCGKWRDFAQNFGLVARVLLHLYWRPGCA